MKIKFCCLFLFIFSKTYTQTTVSFTPEKDNSMFSEALNNSNGAGKILFSGRTEGRANTEVRRALLKFNLSSIPANAQITSVSLQVSVVKAADNTTAPHSFSLHKVLNNWGEGTSSGLGRGSAATANDATWKYRLYSSSQWTTQGGDFVATPSATSSIHYSDFPLEYGIWNSAGMIADVNAWIANAANNFGWVIIGQEATLGSAKGFSSREETIFPKPTLTITYTQPCPNSLVLSNTIASGIYRSAEQITSTGTIANTANVTYTAGKSITLNGVFQVDNGAVFEAKIAGCL